MKIPGTRGEYGRYATLAAIMGVSSSPSASSDSSNDLFDSSSISSTMPTSEPSSLFTQGSSTVRLYGIGRAILCDYYNRIPTSSLGSDDETLLDEEEDDDENGDNFSLRHATPIVMAEFELLLDNDSTPPLDSLPSVLFLGRKNNGNEAKKDNQQRKIPLFSKQSQYSSPVHTLQRLHTASNRVLWMHDSRRKLVAGLKAANARLMNKERTSNEEEGRHLSNFGDGEHVHDELLLLDNEDTVSSDTEIFEDFITAPFNINGQREDIANTNNDNINGQRDEDFSNQLAEQLRVKENFGLGLYGSITSLDPLTDTILQNLVPYYSPSHRDREEYRLEVLSYVSWRALEGVASPEELSWSLRCTSTLERLMRAYDLMLEHRMGLERLAEIVDQELRDCGEECSDLW